MDIEIEHWVHEGAKLFELSSVIMGVINTKGIHSMKRMSSRVLALSLLALAVSIGAPKSASACMPLIRVEAKGPQDNAFLLSSAETNLEKGNALAAVYTVGRAFKDIKTMVAKSGDELRAKRVMAVALVRVNGNANTAGFSFSKASDNVDWAISTLRTLSSQRGDDAALKADLGEALARKDATKAEAATLLGNLAKKDLLGSPYAFATLAKLRAASGDTAGADEAVTRCKSMFNSVVCGTTSAQAATTATPTLVKVASRS